MSDNDAPVKRGKGRPPKQERARDNVLHVYFETAEQLADVKEAARLTGEPMATWARAVLLREAQAVLLRDARRKLAQQAP